MPSDDLSKGARSKSEESSHNLSPGGVAQRTPMGEIWRRSSASRLTGYTHSNADAGQAAHQDGDPSNGDAQTDARWDYDHDDQLIIEVINITSATTNAMQTLQRKAKIVAFQEHSVDGREAADFKQGAIDADREVVLGPLDPELGRKTAGVGFSSTKGLLHMPIKAATQDYDDAVKTGRLLVHQWELQDAVLQVGNVYGWTGGIKVKRQTGRMTSWPY